MSHYIIENSVLKVEISTKGAELQSIYNKTTQLEYLWSGDAAFWGKKSPVLFPIVGGLKNNEYEYEGKKYTLPRHGFARDNEFAVRQINGTTIQFILTSSAITRAVYPFDFEFAIKYYIQEEKVYCTYKVINTGSNTMYFSVGAHPAFAIPLTRDTHFNDWYLQFSKNENCGIHPLTTDGLVKDDAAPYLNNTNTLPLNKALFYNDALVFKNLQSNTISILSAQNSNGLKMQFDGFPYYGIWSAKDANFVCLEPWLGIADTETTNGKLEDKEGIITLSANSKFKATWSLELF
ncbi:MAG: aldose 1-epimerase family protein [Bacteroidetes bacterium]|nr:aldose 1-epimerase family protein [Bacteroidota bacterium]